MWPLVVPIRLDIRFMTTSCAYVRLDIRFMKIKPQSDLFPHRLPMYGDKQTIDWWLKSFVLESITETEISF